MKRRSFSNPLDLNYEVRVYDIEGQKSPICLEAADPVMVVFEEEYLRDEMPAPAYPVWGYDTNMTYRWWW